MSVETLALQPPAFSDTLQADAELPSYNQVRSLRRQFTTASEHAITHLYHLPDKSGHTWLTMRCTSRAVRPQQTPRILEGDNIKGTVEVNLPNWKTVKSVRVSVRSPDPIEKGTRKLITMYTTDIRRTRNFGPAP